MNKHLLDQSYPKTIFRLLPLLIGGLFLTMPAAYSVEKSHAALEGDNLDTISTMAQAGDYKKKLTEEEEIEKIKKEIDESINSITGSADIKTKIDKKKMANGFYWFISYVDNVEILRLPADNYKTEKDIMVKQLKIYQDLKLFIESSNKEFKKIIQQVTDTNHPKICIITDPKNKMITLTSDEFSTKNKKEKAYLEFLKQYKRMVQFNGMPYKGTIVFEEPPQPQD